MNFKISYTLEHYSIAIRKRKSTLLFEGNMESFEEIEFPFSERFWAADPFVIEENNNAYLFYEYFDNLKQKGCIAYSILDGNKASKPTIILKKNYHLSFPNVFKINNDYYMIPETASHHDVELYKAVKFPNEWKLERVLLKGIDVCDSVVLKKENCFLLLTSQMDRSLSNYYWCYVKKRLFCFDDNGVWEMKIENNVGDYGIRNGGAIIIKNGFIRVGQNCTNNEYGKGLIFWKTSGDLKDLYIIKSYLCSELEKNIIWHDKRHNSLKGMHTYNVSANYEVIDVSENRLYQNIFIRINNILIRMIRNKK